MQVILAKTAGFCYGVARAVRIAQDTAEKGGGAMLGSIVHNAHVIEELERSGMRQISSAQEAGRGERVLIRAHGEAKKPWTRLQCVALISFMRRVPMCAAFKALSLRQSRRDERSSSSEKPITPK